MPISQGQIFSEHRVTMGFRNECESSRSVLCFIQRSEAQAFNCENKKKSTILSGPSCPIKIIDFKVRSGSMSLSPLRFPPPLASSVLSVIISIICLMGIQEWALLEWLECHVCSLWVLPLQFKTRTRCAACIDKTRAYLIRAIHHLTWLAPSSRTKELLAVFHVLCQGSVPHHCTHVSLAFQKWDAICSMSTVSSHSKEKCPFHASFSIQQKRERHAADVPSILQLGLQPHLRQPGLHEAAPRCSEVHSTSTLIQILFIHPPPQLKTDFSPCHLSLTAIPSVSIGLS